MSARMRLDLPAGKGRLRPADRSGNATVLPLMVCAAALAVAVLVLGMLATGMARPHGTEQPAWSGDQAPPGAVGLGPEQRTLTTR